MAKTLFIFFAILFTILANCSVFVQSIANAIEEDQNENPLRQAMAVVDMITRFNDIKGRAIRSFPDPISALAELTLFGAVKLVFGLIAGVIALGTVFPSTLAAVGISAPFLVRTVAENVGNLDYEFVSRSIRSLPEKSLEALDIKGDDCKSRAVCEVGKYGARVFPTAAGYVRAFGNKFNFNEKYLSAVVKGMSKVDCAKAYQTCRESPFKKLSYLSTYNIF